MSRAPNHQLMLGKLTDYLTGLRPDWSQGETRRTLDNAYRDRHTLGLIAAAAIDAAMNGTAQPEMITAHLANGWGTVTRGWTKQAIDAAKNPLPHGQKYPRCGDCGQELIAGETREMHTTRCPERIDRGSPDRLAAIDAARVAAAAATDAAVQYRAATQASV